MSYKLRVERHGVCFLQVQQALESQESRWQHPQAIRDTVLMARTSTAPKRRGNQSLQSHQEAWCYRRYSQV